MRLWAHEEELWACLLTNKHQSAAMVNYVVCGATRKLEHVPLHTICCIASKGLPLFMLDYSLQC